MRMSEEPEPTSLWPYTPGNPEGEEPWPEDEESEVKSDL